MEQAEFSKYVTLLQGQPFTIYPAPIGPDKSVLWHSKRFDYVDDSATHVIVRDVDSKKTYQLPPKLVEFANPGILRLTREVAPSNGSFI